MTSNDDDLGWNDDDPLVRALRAPGTPEELAGEADFLAAFRAQQTRGGTVRRLVGRVGFGATTAVVTVTLTAGVAAAAYTQVLPDPVQRVFHHALGPVGVPAPAKHRPTRPATAPVTSSPSTSSPASSPPVTPSTPATRPPTGPPVPASRPGQTSSAQSTPEATSSPATPQPTATTPAAPQQPRRVPAALRISVPSRTAPVGTSVSVSGTVTSSDGHRLRNRAVRLQGRSADHGWTLLGRGSTDAAGRITLETGALAQTTRVRLATTHQVRSAVATVVVVPAVDATALAASGTTTVTVTTRGGQPGDVVKAYRRQGDELVQVGRATVDQSGTAVLSLPTPKRQVRIVVVLAKTRHHGAAHTAVTLKP